MNDEPREILKEFQSPIFDVIDGHQLADYIRTKNNNRSKPLKIFDNVHTNRKSLQIEIQQMCEKEKLDAFQNKLQAECRDKNNPIKIQIDAKQLNSTANEKTNKSIMSRSTLHSIGRQALVSELEKTLQESQFLPASSSTPLHQDTSKFVSSSQHKNHIISQTRQKDLLKQYIVSSSITTTDSDSPSLPQSNFENQAPTTDGSTTDVMRDLKQHNDMLLKLNESSEELPTTANKNLNSVPNSSTTWQLNLSPENSRKRPLTTNQLIVTPEQRKLLLNKYGPQKRADSTRREFKSTTVQGASNIEIIHKAFATCPPLMDHQANTSCRLLENTVTFQHNKQLNDCNQMFNQSSTITVCRKVSSSKMSSSFEVTSTTKSMVTKQNAILQENTSDDDEIHLSRLRLEDIITDCNESSGVDVSSSLEHQPSRILRSPPKRLPVNTSCKQQSRRYMREWISAKELAQMSESQIVDLLKRNSRGELQKSYQMTKPESDMFEKQLNLELISRSIHNNNYEDEFQLIEASPVQYNSNRNSLDTCLEMLKRVSKSESKYTNLSKRKLFNNGYSDESSDESLKQISKGRRERKDNIATTNSDTESIPGLLLHSPTSSVSFVSEAFHHIEPSPHISSPLHFSSPTQKSPSGGSYISQRISSHPHGSQKNTLTDCTYPQHPTLSSKNHINSPLKQNTQVPISDEVIFKVPYGRPPKKKPVKQKLDFSHPVDPDDVSTAFSNTNSFPTLRRSSRKKKPLTAYWSCSQTEYRPLFDLNILFSNKSKKKKAYETRSCNNDCLAQKILTKQTEKTSLKAKRIEKKYTSSNNQATSSDCQSSNVSEDPSGHQNHSADLSNSSKGSRSKRLPKLTTIVSSLKNCDYPSSNITLRKAKISEHCAPFDFNGSPTVCVKPPARSSRSKVSKASRMCVAQEVNCGHISHRSRNKAPQGDKQVGDSGFSSEDMGFVISKN